jgi:dienelactone hydrolase
LHVRRQIAASGGDLEAVTAPLPDLDRAFDRIDDFLAVQGAACDLPAVLALQEAVGVDDASRAVIGERIAALADAGHRAAAGSVLLGILVGLFAVEEA